MRTVSKKQYLITIEWYLSLIKVYFYILVVGNESFQTPLFAFSIELIVLVVENEWFPYDASAQVTTDMCILHL